MKTFHYATLTGFVIAVISAQVVSAAGASTGPLTAIADIVLRLDGVHAELVDESLVVFDNESGQSICILSSEQEGIVAIVAGGTVHGVIDGLGEVDMSHLDAAAVGVLVVDRVRNRWTLTHRFDARLASAAQVEDLLARFAHDAAAARSRFERGLSIVR